jgi:uncharacterized Zn finger protein
MSYGFIIDGCGLYCPQCATRYDDYLEEVYSEGYPDGYTCADCGEVKEGESE